MTGVNYLKSLCISKQIFVSAARLSFHKRNNLLINSEVIILGSPCSRIAQVRELFSY